MNKTQRKLYTLFFVILFLITAPTLILIAKGYRFDMIGKVFVHSGSIIVKSTPKKVDIYIDHKKVSHKMLNFINNYYIVNGIKPGRHTLECRKDGYTNWKKRIVVHSGISTEFWNVLLFPKNNTTEEKYPTKNAQRFFLSPRNKNELVLYKITNDNNSLISLYDIKNKEETVLYSSTDYDKILPNQQENIEWSSNHKKILAPVIKDNNKDYIILSDNEKNSMPKTLTTFLNKFYKSINNQATNIQEKNLQNNQNKNTTKKQTDKELMKNKKTLVPQIYLARWIFNSDKKIIILTTSQELLIIDTKNISDSVMVDNEVNGFDLAGDHIYYTKNSDNFIWDIKQNQPQKKKAIGTTTFNNEEGFVKIIAYDEYRLAFITKKHNLYIFNKDKDDDKNEIFFGKLGNNVKNIQFSDDGKKILYWSDNEIFVYLLRDWKVQPKRQKGKKILLTRFSSSIQNVQWLENFENVLFTNGYFVKIIEIDDRDYLNINDVFKTTIPAEEYKYIYNKDTHTLFFLNKNNSDSKEILHSIQLIENDSFLNIGK